MYLFILVCRGFRCFLDVVVVAFVAVAAALVVIALQYPPNAGTPNKEAYAKRTNVNNNKKNAFHPFRSVPTVPTVPNG